jgi:hypothetical protein
MESNLKSMVEFVKEQKQKFDKVEGRYNEIYYFKEICNHAILLSQQPNIGMFVPAVCENGVWKVLEEPWKTQYEDDYFYELDLEQYQQAQSKVIFKGWELYTYEKGVHYLHDYNSTLIFDSNQNECNIDSDYYYGKIHTLEDLVKFNLEMI